jgi:type I restriction enzyme S subunit
MTKPAKPELQAPKGRKKTAQGNALGRESPAALSPEWARQTSSAPHNDCWRDTSLGAVITSIDTGKSFRCEERPPDESEVGVVKVSAVTWGTYDEEESKTCLDAACIEPRYLIEEGDFLFSRANTIQLIGPCVIAGAPSRRLVLSDKILRFRFTDEVETKWVLHWLRSKRGRSEIERLSSGNQESMRNIGQDRIRAIAIPLPPPCDQRRIVAEIEKQFTRLEAGVAALRRVQANLKRYRAAVLAAACEGRLVPTQAELARAEGRPFESGQQLLARLGTSSSLPHTKRRAGRLWGAGHVPQLTDEESETLPIGWVWTKVKEVGNDPETAVQVGPMSMKSSDFTDDGVPVLNVGCVQWGRFAESKLDHLPPSKASEFERYRILPGDVLFTRSGTVGRCAVAQPHQHGWLMTFHLLRARPDPQKCVPSFLRIVFEGAPHIRRQTSEASVGSTRAGFNTNLLANLDIPLPPLAEQTRIVAEVERRLSVVEELEAVVTTNLQRATRLRQSILQKAFTGELQCP